MSNDKMAATFGPYDHPPQFPPYQAVLGDLPPYDEASAGDPDVKIDANSIADMLCDQLQLFMEEGGNDLQGIYVDEVTFGGRIVTVDWSNGQRFRVEVEEVIISED